jgi:hypothetical protein
LPRVNIREDGRSKLPTYKDVVKRDRIAEWWNYWEKVKRKAWINNSSIKEKI